ncbi:unnamed protein product [Peniophora sp. CBMAI 1063]|nr:unnamed protein product [Peniophora sp. CBMAI 1063]
MSSPQSGHSRTRSESSDESDTMPSLQSSTSSSTTPGSSPKALSSHSADTATSDLPTPTAGDERAAKGGKVSEGTTDDLETLVSTASSGSRDSTSIEDVDVVYLLEAHLRESAEQEKAKAKEINAHIAEIDERMTRFSLTIEEDLKDIRQTAKNIQAVFVQPSDDLQRLKDATLRIVLGNLNKRFDLLQSVPVASWAKVSKDMPPLTQAA